MAFLFWLYFTVCAYPFEQVMISPLDLIGISKPALQTFLPSSLYSGIVLLPAGIRSYSVCASKGFFSGELGYLSSGRIIETNVYGEEEGDFSAGIIRGIVTVKAELGAINYQFSLAGLRASGPDFLKKTVWVDLNLYRRVYMHEYIILGITAGERNHYSACLYGQYHALDFNYTNTGEYSFTALLNYGVKYVSAIFGAKYLKQYGETYLVPLFSLRFKYRGINFTYAYRFQQGLPGLSSIILSLE